MKFTTTLMTVVALSPITLLAAQQKRIEKILDKKLKSIDDEFQSGEYYRDKWGFDVDLKESKHAIPHWEFKDGAKGRVFTPTKRY